MIRIHLTYSTIQSLHTIAYDASWALMNLKISEETDLEVRARANSRLHSTLITLIYIRYNTVQDEEGNLLSLIIIQIDMQMTLPY